MGEGPLRTFCCWGAGVQSTALSLIHRHQPELLERIGMIPEAYIFSDPGAELTWTEFHIKNLLRGGYFAAPFYRTSGGSILDDKGNRTLPPFHVMGGDGKKSILTRKCTKDLKVIPTERKARELAGLKGKRCKRGTIRLLLGISLDEVERMKPGKGAFSNHYPLIELRWDRNRCRDYCREILGYEVQKSACYMCPYRRDWKNMRDNHPADFADALAYDRSLRDGTRGKANTKQPRYLHRYLMPLDEAMADEELRAATLGEPLFDDFINECEGYCGI